MIGDEQDLRARLGEELKREEQLWRQKSRVTWLTTPDLNTRFFHLSTIVRRRRNSIDALLDPNGQWLEGRESIGAHVVAHFQHLFSGGQTEFPGALPDLMPPLITAEDNMIFVAAPVKRRFGVQSEVWVPLKLLDPMAFQLSFFRHIGLLLKRRWC